jgi:tetratricopeptide (TPR) repeat protein
VGNNTRVVASAPSAPSAPSLPLPAPGARRWLFGPSADLLLGCGLGYVALFAAFLFAGGAVRESLPASFFPLLTLLIGSPHYGATLLRVYERSEDRRGYVVFGLWVSLAIWSVFALSIYWPLLGSVLVTVYLTWNAWHYSGQNYGLSVMFLGRRGIRVEPPVKRALHASFLLSFAMTAVAVHAVSSTSTYGPEALYGTNGVYRFLPLGIPAEVAAPALLLCASAYLATVGGALVGLLRVARLGDLAPTLVLVGVQALWFVVPLLARAAGLLQRWEPLSAQHAAYYFLWIACAHFLQYLWISVYFAAKDERYPGLPRYLGKTLLLGAAIYGVPALLFAPGLIGRVSFESGLFLLVAAAVNLHHFILDGAIWKLRDRRVGSVLVGGGVRAAEAPAPARRRVRWLPAAIYASGALCVAVSVGGALESEIGYRAALRRDAARLETAARRLAWMGRDGPSTHVQLGGLALARGDWEAALGSYRRALALDPNHADALEGAAVASLRLRRSDDAIVLLEHAMRVQPQRPGLADQWRRAVAQRQRLASDPAAATP